MYRSGIILLILSGASWALVGNVSGDWQVAGFTLVAILIFGYVLLMNTVRKYGATLARKDTVDLSKAIAQARAERKSLENMRTELNSLVSEEIALPLARAEKSLSFLLSGTYGSLPPAAEEAVRQVETVIANAATASEKYLLEDKEVPLVPGAQSITKLKIS